MTAQDDRQKYGYICELVEKTYPILAPVWRAAHARFGAAWLREFIENIEVVYGKVDVGIEGRLGDALDGYAEFVNDSLRNQSFYEKHRRYRASSYAECVDAYYHNADHMIRCYLPGMYLSHLLWPQHYNMLCGFRDGMLRRLEQPKLFFEVGVGCGMYSKVLLAAFPGDPRHRLRHQPLCAEIHQRPRHPVRPWRPLYDRAARHPPWLSWGCDFLVCQEVLEHLENPEEFCRWLFDMVKPGGHAYITAAVNAAHSDHIFHFRDPLQLEAMLRAAGFQPMSLQEEFAAGYKPREITPSLAGYLVERRAVMPARQTQPWQIADLSLAELLKQGQGGRARALPTAELRLGILGDCATQHYSQCVAAALKLRGIWPEIYEAEFDSIQQETARPRQRRCSSHRPTAVILFNCVQKLEERYARATQPDGFVQQVVDEMAGSLGPADCRGRRNHSAAQFLPADVPPVRQFHGRGAGIRCSTW